MHNAEYKIVAANRMNPINNYSHMPTKINKLRQFALKGLFNILQTSKGKIKLVVPLFQLPVEKAKHPNFEWRGRGVDCFVLKFPFLSTMPLKFCRRLISIIIQA